MLVDRLWPRGISKEKAALDQWNKEIAPSAPLRKWFAHKPELFEAFTEKYKKELLQKEDELRKIKNIARSGNLTLLYAAKDPKMNNAAILLEVLQQTE